MAPHPPGAPAAAQALFWGLEAISLALGDLRAQAARGRGRGAGQHSEAALGRGQVPAAGGREQAVTQCVFCSGQGWGQVTTAKRNGRCLDLRQQGHPKQGHSMWEQPEAGPGDTPSGTPESADVWMDVSWRCQDVARKAV